MDDDAIRLLVTRLSRPHSSGGQVIGRAAILAEGAESGAIIEWIGAHHGVPEELAPAAADTGLHSARLSDRARSDGAPPAPLRAPARRAALSVRAPGARRPSRLIRSARPQRSPAR